MQSSLSFSTFATKINELYGEVNKVREFEYMYSYLCRNSSYLSRSVLRKGDSKLFFAKSFSWLFAAAEKVGVDLGTAFRKKFPNVCPYCVASTCQCNETHRAPINGLPAYKVRDELNEKYNSDKNSTPVLGLDKAIERIGVIYPANKAIWNAFGSFYHFSRLFEELGEVHEAYSSYQKTGEILNLEEEFADVTAWLLSAWGIHNKGESLSDHLMDYYMSGCPVCKKAICECNEYSDRPQMLSDKASLEEVKLRIIDIINSYPHFKSELEDLLGSMDQAIASSSTVDAKQAVNSAKRTLEAVEEIVSSTEYKDGNAEEVKSAVRAVYSAISALKSQS